MRSSATAQSIVPDTGYTSYNGIVNAYTDIGVAGGAVNGFALSPAGTGILLNATDSTGRPLFAASAADGPFGKILGQKAVEARGLYKAGAAGVGTAAGTPAVVGVAGDWTKALWGTVEGVQIKISEHASVYIGTELVNLWQRNMFAVMAEIECGFRADVNCFNRLLGAVPSGS